MSAKTITTHDLERLGFTVVQAEAADLIIQTEGLWLRVGGGPAWVVEIHSEDPRLEVSKPAVLIFDGQTQEGAAAIHVETSEGSIELT